MFAKIVLREYGTDGAIHEKKFQATSFDWAGRPEGTIAVEGYGDSRTGFAISWKEFQEWYEEISDKRFKTSCHAIYLMAGKYTYPGHEELVGIEFPDYVKFSSREYEYSLEVMEGKTSSVTKKVIGSECEPIKIDSEYDSESDISTEWWKIQQAGQAYLVQKKRKFSGLIDDQKNSWEAFSFPEKKKIPAGQGIYRE